VSRIRCNLSYGRVIFLHGVSSAGKSTLAKVLQRTLDEYWWHIQADNITWMQPTSWWVSPELEGFDPAPEKRPHPSWDRDIVLERWLAGYFGCIATIAKSGSNVIADGGWLKTSWLLQLMDALNGIETLVVGVYCPHEEVERREIARGDRAIGYSRSQWERVHVHAPYDVEVDTHTMTKEAAALVIKEALTLPPAPSFFARIREQHQDNR
jgi:chloramphenicol 3-O phosphotransferase